MRDQRFPAVPLHGELMGVDRHAALVATARTSRASRQALTVYDASPVWREATTGSREEKRAKMADPELRSRLVAAASEVPDLSLIHI